MAEGRYVVKHLIWNFNKTQLSICIRAIDTLFYLIIFYIILRIKSALQVFCCNSGGQNMHDRQQDSFLREMQNPNNGKPPYLSSS